MPKIHARILPDGSTKFDFEGYIGKACIDTDDKLRKLLEAYGVQVAETSFEAKPELYQEADPQKHGQQQKES